MTTLRSSPTLKVIPSARRLVTSLRDVGYDFVHAVADLVDNSIAAGAGEIAIDLRFDGPDSWLRIVDNGAGMNGGTITEAMRYGSQQTYADDDLGKFGLGLKTASMSQCRRLSVASRTDEDVNRVEARQLDLDHIERTDRWEVFAVSAAERSPELVEPLSGGPGTVVLWQALDRVLGYKLPWGEKAKNGLYAMAEQLDNHLGMVFHRFLGGEVRRRKKLIITVNGKRVEPWDPFARTEPATVVLPAAEIDVQTATGVGMVRFQPYVLPAKERFSSEHGFNRLGGPARWNAQQGLYIYRSNRMIQSGGWSRMRTLDEHTKLARASLDFFPNLDSAFEVNVAKVRVSLPAELRDRLRNPVENLVRQAQTAYRQAAQSGTGEAHAPRPAREGHALPPPTPPMPTPPPVHGPNGDDTKHATVGPVHGDAAPPPPGSVRRALEKAAATIGEDAALHRIMGTLRETAPGVARALGW